MKRFMKIGNASGLLSAVLMCVSGGAPIARAGEPNSEPAPQQQIAAPGKRSMDVVTSVAGELLGAVVNADTAPSVNAKVVLAMVGSKESQESTTDGNGRFLFKDVRPGVYSLSANSEKGQAQSVARVWTQETAPPAASSDAVLSLQGEQPQSSDVVYGRPGLGGRGLLLPASADKTARLWNVQDGRPATTRGSPRTLNERSGTISSLWTVASVGIAQGNRDSDSGADSSHYQNPSRSCGRRGLGLRPTPKVTDFGLARR